MKILVGLSWGVDSAVSAYLLKEAGHEVHAGFMINYITDDDSCTTKKDLEIARKVADYLQIPFFTFDYQEQYEARIISFIYDGYKQGITPNPDVLCNNLIKFDLFAEEAKSFGYDAIAMGHYARIKKDETGYHLLKWIDPQKDQSYFLARLSEEQISYALFPIGWLEKSNVREIARRAWLPNAERKDSQWLCFIGKVRMRDFLHERIPEKIGDILNTSGEKIGEHRWAYFYTIWQRKWIELGWGPALFVIWKDIKNNTITVGDCREKSLFQKTCTGIHWKTVRKEFELFSSLDLKAKIRYRQEDQDCIASIQNDRVVVHFTHEQRAVAPWQFVVLYQWDEVVWSGFIEDTP